MKAKSGGRRMVEEGALQGLDAVFGLHVNSYTDTGRVRTRSGPLLAAGSLHPGGAGLGRPCRPPAKHD